MFPSVTFYWLFPCAFPKDLCGGALSQGLEGVGCWKCVGREGVGLCLCRQMGSVTSPRGSSGQWSFLASVHAMAGSPCCGQQQDPSPPSLAVTWQQEQPLSRVGLLQHCGLQKFPLGTSVSFHFHCNKVLQCAVTDAVTDLLLGLMKTWKPGEAPWEGNVCNLDLTPLLEKNLSLHLSSCKDSP